MCGLWYITGIFLRTFKMWCAKVKMWRKMRCNFFVRNMEEGIHIALKAGKLTEVFGVPITNTMVMSWLVMLVLIALGYTVGTNLKKIPGKLQTFFEMFFAFFIDYIEEVLDSRELARRFFPFLATFFLFILLCNWFELMPGVESIYMKQKTHAEETLVETAETNSVSNVTDVDNDHVKDDMNIESKIHKVPLFYPATVDLNFTLAMALISFVMIEISGIMYVGGLKYFSKFINFRSIIGFFVGIIELISEFARIISFSFRLFGNMFAGETLIIVASFFVPLLLPMPIMLYEVFVGVIQASIFTLLTLFFIKLAIAESH